MSKDAKYKTAIAVLCLVIILQGALILRLLPKRIAVRLPVVKGRIAIVIDDWGYNLNNLSLLADISYPLTLSVLPALPYSERISSEAKKRGLEVILHLPLEPLPSEFKRLEQNTIMTDMDEAKIKNILLADLSGIHGVKGISNHMGSKATTSAKVMETVFLVMKKRGLYFFDSLVSRGSVAKSLSRTIGIKFAKRDIFLDNEASPDYIKGQIKKLKNIALSRGYAIGVGHDRATTLRVLIEVMPELKKEGLKFVFVSELAN